MIILADDDADQRLSLKLALELAGYTVREAADGSQALASHEGNNELAIQANVRTLGEYKMFVGGAVLIRGVDNVNDGLWYVSKVVHHMTAPNTFETDAVLGRDGFTGVALPTKPLKQVARSARLLNNQWVLA